MKKIAAHLATTSDTLLQEKEEVEVLAKEIAVFNRKTVSMNAQLVQEMADKEIIEQKLEEGQQVKQKKSATADLRRAAQINQSRTLSVQYPPSSYCEPNRRTTKQKWSWYHGTSIDNLAKVRDPKTGEYKVIVKDTSKVVRSKSFAGADDMRRLSDAQQLNPYIHNDVQTRTYSQVAQLRESAREMALNRQTNRRASQ
jgi:hypothetical protein